MAVAPAEMLPENQADISLSEIVDALDPVVALLSLVHLSGDTHLLHQYGPALDGTQESKQEAFVNFGGEAPKVADPMIVADIRAKLKVELAKGHAPVIRNLTPGLFRTMSRLALGHDLPEASMEVSRQHSGFLTDTRLIEQTKLPSPDFHVIVIGGGMIGINAAIKLKQAGFGFTVLESRHEIGGTWSVNKYPGAAVDTPSMLYSYSFEVNPSWTKYYPMKDEYFNYLNGVAQKYRLDDDIHLNTSVTEAHWDEAEQIWTVKAICNGEEREYRANAVIMSVGVLSRPRYPDIQNKDLFKGPIVHSAAWDSDVDLRDKKVVVVGTGCSGVQLTRALSEISSHVTVIQRQPDYIIPNPKALMDVPLLERLAMERIPFVAQWKRAQSLASAMADMKGMMSFDQEWHDKTGGFGPLNDAITQMSLGYLKSHFPDNPEMVEMLTPPYPLYAKRPILDCGYYDTLKKDHVQLVQGELAACGEDHIILSDGTRIECDALVLATGFHLDWYTPMHIVGKAGRTLKEEFTPYPYAYEGMLVPQFPNFLITHGPNSNLTANAAVLGEQQVHYIVELFQTMVEQDIAAVEVQQGACDDYNQRTQEALKDTAWFRKGAAHGYYRHDDSGRIVIATPRHNSTVWHDTRRPKMEHMICTAADGSQVTPKITAAPEKPLKMLSI